MRQKRSDVLNALHHVRALASASVLREDVARVETASPISTDLQSRNTPAENPSTMSILPDMNLLKNLTNTTSMETYRAVATSLLAQHSPERYEYIPRDDWPDYLPRRDKLPSEPNYSGPVLDTSAGPRDNVGAIIKPADYGLPMLNPPFCYIDNRDALTDAGQAVYGVFSTINFIIASPAVELGNRQEIAEKVKELHRTHGYPLDRIKDQLLPLAQQRGDIPTYR